MIRREFDDEDLPLLTRVKYKLSDVNISIDDHVLDVIMSENAKIMGLNPSEVTPSSEKCKLVLEKGTSCTDFIGVRRYVLCYAWNLLKQGKEKSFKSAIDKAWAYVKQYCPNI